tara:strand:+ start:4255 stop:5490 length:1236 start_codon:yes stop_codon:yes gene_type:complete
MNSIIKNFLHTIIIFFIIIILFQSEILSDFIWALPDPFGDFKAPINWLECHNLGFNLLTLDKIDCGNGKNIGQFNYGYIFLYTPYNEALDFFYRNYLPWILVFLFIFFTTIIIKPKNKIETLLLYLALLNPSTLLFLERMQIDCLFYLAIILVIFNRYYFINWALGIYFALIKFYPIALLISIFIENKERSFKKIIIIFFSLSVIFLTILFFHFDEYNFMINNMLPGKPGYHFLYSLNSLPKIFKYIFEIKYQILLLIFYSLFIFFVVKLVKKMNSFETLINNSLFSNESKLFTISGFFNLFLFILVSSYVYKEVYLILFIPFILKMKNNKIRIFEIIIYIYIARYLYIFLYSFINVNDGISFEDGKRIFSEYFLITIFIKSILDFILMIFMVSLLYIKTRLYIHHLLKLR